MEIQEKAGSFELGLEIGKRRMAVKQPSSKVRILETRSFTYMHMNTHTHKCISETLKGSL